MLLYELAIVLDERSPDVVDAAAELGFGDLQAGSDLDAEQVAALRAHFSGAAVPPPLAPLGSGMPPLPAVPSGPLAAEPLVFGDPAQAPSSPPSGAPQAPASWGPPPGASVPPSWGPPTGAAPPPLSSDGDPHVGPYFTAPAPTAGEVVDAPLGLSGVTLPPSPPAGPPPGAPASAPSGGMGTGQKVAIGGAVAVVLGLFGFMALNTGPDHSRQRQIDAGERAIEAELAATTTAPPTTTTAVPTTTAAPAQDVYAPVDVDRFCQGGLGVATFELRMAAAIADGDFAELEGLVRDRRAGWNGDVDTMSSGAAPTLVDEIEQYRTGYDQLFDAVASSGSMDEVFGKVDQVTLAKSTNAARQVGAQIEFECE